MVGRPGCPRPRRTAKGIHLPARPGRTWLATLPVAATVALSRLHSRRRSARKQWHPESRLLSRGDVHRWTSLGKGRKSLVRRAHQRQSPTIHEFRRVRRAHPRGREIAVSTRYHGLSWRGRSLDASRDTRPRHRGLSVVDPNQDGRGTTMGNRYIIERRGGFAGPRGSGGIDDDALNPDDRQTLEQLLDAEEPLAADPGADRYTYVVTRETAVGRTTREIPESVMPAAVARVVTTQI